MSIITEDWLREVGFKYDCPDMRRPEFKHWTLWFGDCIPDCCGDELGIELASNRGVDWFCWLRSDMAHRYHRFVHLRRLTLQSELARMIEGITGQEWNPANNFFGVMRSPKTAESYRKESDRFDRHLVENNCPWDTAERDSDLGKPNNRHRRIATGNKRIIGGQPCDD